MTLECRIENNRPELIRDVDEIHLASAIRRLDGSRYSALWLQAPQGERDEAEGLTQTDLWDGSKGLAIGGGSHARYLVSSLSGNPYEIWNLAQPELGDGPRTAFSGGQVVTAPEQHWVGQAEALRAAEHYLEHCARDPSLTWEREPDPAPSRGNLSHRPEPPSGP